MNKGADYFSVAPVLLGVPDRPDYELNEPAWMAEAACVGMAYAEDGRTLPTNPFFPTDASVAAAKRVCADCAVRDACLEWAIATRQEHGVWGGTSEQERRRRREHRVAAS